MNQIRDSLQRHWEDWKRRPVKKTLALLTLLGLGAFAVWYLGSEFYKNFGPHKRQFGVLERTGIVLIQVVCCFGLAVVRASAPRTFGWVIVVLGAMAEWQLQGVTLSNDRLANLLAETGVWVAMLEGFRETGILGSRDRSKQPQNVSAAR